MMHAEQVLIAELSRRSELLTKLQQCVQNREALDARHTPNRLCVGRHFLQVTVACWQLRIFPSLLCLS